MPASLREIFPDACLNCPQLTPKIVERVKEELAISRALTATADSAELAEHDAGSVATTREIADTYKQKAAGMLPSCEPGVWIARSENSSYNPSFAECGQRAGVIILNVTAGLPPETIDRPNL